METPDQPANSFEPDETPPCTALVADVPDHGHLRELGTNFGLFLCTGGLISKIRKKKKRSDILVITLRNLDKALGMFSMKYEGAAVIQQQHQLRPLISQIIINRIDVITSAVSFTNNSPALLTDEDLSLLGQLLAPLLVSESTSVSAVDEWILKYPVLGEVDVAHAWFRPLVYEIAKKLKADTDWGAHRRLFVGAALSMLDMGTDINMVLIYWNTPGMVGAGDLMMQLLLANVAWQLLLVIIIQNRKAPWKVLFWEILYVLTCTKVGVDVFRVASGAKRETYRTMDTDAELGE